MTKRYSYLDSLNAGRERRAGTSYEDINRALDNLESTFDSLSAKRRSSGVRDWTPPDFRRNERDRWPSRSGEPQGGRPASSPHDLSTLTRDIDRARAQEESLSSLSRIASDLTALRRDMRSEMTHALSGQFDSLRREIENLYDSASQGRSDPAIAGELQRISSGIAALGNRSDDRTLNALMGEMDLLKEAISDLAREGTVRSIGKQWDGLGERFVAMERHLAALPQSNAADIDARLLQIVDAVGQLPESLPIRSLEDKIRALATAIDHFSRAQDGAPSHAFDAIEQRLDEIARAIAATSASVQSTKIPLEPFERIEARISSLARTIEESFVGRGNDSEPIAFAELNRRLDHLAEQSGLPQQALDRLTGQIDRIASVLEESDQSGNVEALRSFEHRFEALAELLQHQQETTVRQSAGQVRAIEQRLEEMIGRLEDSQPASAGAPQAHGIENRLAELTQRVSEIGHGASAEGFRALTDRLDEISGRLDVAKVPVQGIDPDLVRNLETQVAGLSALLARPEQGGVMPDDIAIRLDRLEDAVTVSRDAVLDAARIAAEEAIRSAPGNPNGPAILALADDLKTLDSLARRADERNTKTFEAIHETLLKIVDRLVTLESARAEPVTKTKAEKIVVEKSPALQHEPESADLPLREPSPTELRRVSRSPAEAATEAAFAAIEREGRRSGEAPQEEKKSLLGGIAKALGRSRDNKAEPAAKPAPHSERTDADQTSARTALDPTLANQPLEPGSGAPDLNAIMRRVREERKGAGGAEAEAGQADFVAAARRAAQAAAAEAETLKNRADKSGAKGASLIDTLKLRRKPILMAVGAIIIALSGLQLGKQFFADAPQTEVVAEQPQEPKTNNPVVSGEVPAVRSELTPGAATVDPAQSAPDVRVATPSAPVPEPAAIPPVSAAEPVQASTSAAKDDVVSPAPQAPESQPVAAYAAPADAGPFGLIEAAKTGDPRALFEIGSRYADGRNGKTDLEAAATWYEKAAELGLAPAQYRIGNLYEKGTGVARDLDKAKTWYQMAAEQGNASAMHNLAVLFATGTGQGADNESSVRWFHAAAELGVKDSQYNLGILAAKGIGMTQNLEDSYKWFALAAKSGDKDAAAKRDEIAKALRPEQLEKARGATELWQPKSLDPSANSVDIPASWSDGDSRTASVDMQKAIKNIQAILAKNGYDAGTPDGVMGAKTKSAISAYQKANGMAETGEIDEALVRSLLGKK